MENNLLEAGWGPDLATEGCVTLLLKDTNRANTSTQRVCGHSHGAYTQGNLSLIYPVVCRFGKDLQIAFTYHMPCIT